MQKDNNCGIPASIHIFSDNGKPLISSDAGLKIPPGCAFYAVQYDGDGRMVSMISGNITDNSEIGTPEVKLNVPLQNSAQTIKLTLFDAENMLPISEKQVRL